MELARACASEATMQIDSPGADATVFEPAPSNLRAVLRIRDNVIREAWLKVGSYDGTLRISWYRFLYQATDPSTGQNFIDFFIFCSDFIAWSSAPM